MNKKHNRIGLIAFMTIGITLLSLFWIACEGKESALWKTEKWSLEMESLHSFAITVEDKLPIVAINGTDLALLEHLKTNEQLIKDNIFTIRTAPNEGKNLALSYTPVNNNWSLKYGYNTPQIYQDSQISSINYFGTNYSIWHFVIKDSSYFSPSLVANWKTTYFLLFGELESTVVSGTHIYSLISERAHSGSDNFGNPFSLGADQLTLRTKSITEILSGTFTPPEKAGSPLEKNVSALISDVELISTVNSNLTREDLLFGAWVKEGKLYLIKGDTSSTGFQASEKLVVAEGLPAKKQIVAMAIQDQKLHVFVANNTSLLMIPIDIAKWKALETKTLEVGKEIQKIRAISNKANRLAAFVQVEKELFIIETKKELQLIKTIDSVTDFDVAMDDKTVWICIYDGKKINVKKATIN